MKLSSSTASYHTEWACLQNQQIVTPYYNVFNFVLTQPDTASSVLEPNPTGNDDQLIPFN